MILRVKDENGNVIEVLAIKGEKGDTYTLTETDKQEIAELVFNMIESGDGVEY